MRDKNYILALVLIIVIVGGIYSISIASRSLWEPDEARYAQIANTMVTSGNWLEPTLNYRKHFEKPPLFYWLLAGSIRMFGKNEFAARLPVFIAALMVLALVYLASVRWWGNIHAGVYASLVLASSIGFGFLARVVLPDMFFIASATLIAFLALNAYGRPTVSPKYSIVLGIVCGLSFLLKGPIAMIVIGITLGILHYTQKPRARGAHVYNAFFWASFAVTALPWFLVLMRAREGLFSYWTKTLVVRFLEGSGYHKEPFYFFIPLFLIFLLPWSIFLPRMTAFYLRLKGHEIKVKFCLIASVVGFLFFSVSKGKLPHYILFIFPFLAMAFGYFLSHEKVRTRAVYFFPEALTLAACGIAVIVAAPFCVARAAKTGIPLPIPVINLYLVLLSLAIVLLVISARRRNTTLMLAVVCGIGLSWQALFAAVAPHYEYYAKTVKPIMETLNDSSISFGKIYSYKTNPNGLLFYGKVPCVFVEIPQKIYFFPEKAGAAQPEEYFHISESEFFEKIRKKEKMLCVASRGDFSFLESITAERLTPLTTTRRYVVFLTGQ